MSRALTKFLLILTLYVLGWIFLAPPVLASDLRTVKLAKFLRRQNSVLEPYAQTYVDTADKYGLDYRLLPAIAGTESTFGRNFIPGTYNVYGWGVGQIPFTSWEDGIDKVAAGLKDNYINKGAKEVYQIGSIYCPPTYLHWSGSVLYFMNEIDATDASSITTLASNLPITL